MLIRLNDRWCLYIFDLGFLSLHGKEYILDLSKSCDGTISVAGVLDLVSELRRLSFDWSDSRLFFFLGYVDELDLSDRIPVNDYLYWLNAIKNRKNLPEFGLILGQTIEPTSKGVLASWVSQASTINEALDIFIANISLMSTVEYWELNVKGSVVELTLSFAGCDEYPVVAIERSMSAIVTWGNILSGKKMPLLKASFTFDEPNYVEAYDSIFDCEMHFSAESNTLEISSAFLDTRIVTGSRFLKSIAEEKAKEVLDSVSGNHSVADRVKVLVNDSLDNGAIIGMESICCGLHMSRQTLYRRLRDEGTNYKEIVDHIRKERMKIMLGSGERNFSKICFQLAFKDTSSFYKAFRRWFGVTPSEYLTHIVRS